MTITDKLATALLEADTFIESVATDSQLDVRLRAGFTARERISHWNAVLAEYNAQRARPTTPTADHTQEPWRAYFVRRNPNAPIHEGQVRDSRGNVIAVTAKYGEHLGAPQTDNKKEAVIRRIVACVNACTGIPTEQLEAMNDAIESGSLARAYAALCEVKRSVPPYTAEPYSYARMDGSTESGWCVKRGKDHICDVHTESEARVVADLLNGAEYGPHMCG